MTELNVIQCLGVVSDSRHGFDQKCRCYKGY